MEHDRKYEWYLSFLKKIGFFLVLASMLLLFYYILGNFGGFLDSTQTLLLSMLEISALFGSIIELYRIVILFVIGVREKNLRIFQFITVCIFFVYFLCIYILIKFLGSWF